MRAVVVLATLALAGCASSDVLLLGTTTTAQDAGLLDVLLPAFEAATGVAIQPVVGGTGEVIEKAKRGDVDVLLTHAPAREARLVEEGWAARRTPAMGNPFAVAGPAEDPARVAEATSAADGLRRIHDARATFASRGDESGTHEKERELWAAAGLDPAAFDPAWYEETGTGQGATLLFASERDAYLLIDEATLAQLHARGLAANIVDLLRGDPALRNEYSVLTLNATRLPGIDAAGADAFAAWIAGPQGRAAIASLTLDGKPLFSPEG